MPAKKSKSSTPTAASAAISDLLEGAETKSQQLARLVTNASGAAGTVQQYARAGDGLDALDLLAELRRAGDEAVAGDLGRYERMLASQAITLDSMFHNLAERAGRQQMLPNMEMLLRMALKAQSQARATVEALAAIKNPVPYIRQANIAHGHQQVNNGRAGLARRKPGPRRTNYWRSTMANGWSMERRQRQAELIRRWRPWEQSTGPRTEEGRQVVARNAWRRAAAAAAEVGEGGECGAGADGAADDARRLSEAGSPSWRRTVRTRTGAVRRLQRWLSSVCARPAAAPRQANGLRLFMAWVPGIDPQVESIVHQSRGSHGVVFAAGSSCSIHSGAVHRSNSDSPLGIQSPSSATGRSTVRRSCPRPPCPSAV
ncbi:hypothetical protein ACFSTJ_20095 [Ottowia pentelensis]|uniref:hypothetical protein n=1 Tax=Ottowia pentelensis TaxID=511108 RepID=UPI003645BF70